MEKDLEMTGSLIGEIIQKSISGDTPLSDLLRMVKIAAFRLDLTALEDWVDKELTGYEDDVPEYRQLRGQVVEKNPIYGWRIVAGDPATINLLQQHHLTSSVAQLEAMLGEATENGRGGTYTMHYPRELIEEVMGKDARYVQAMGTRLAFATISGVIDRVRNKVLEWAIEMERKGIVGNGMTFSAKEKEQAAQITTNVTFMAPVGTMAGNIGSGNSSGSITVNGASLAEALEIARSIQQIVPQLISVGAHHSLSNHIADLASELASPSPDKGKIRSLADLSLTALAGASGNLLASGAIEAIGKIGTILPF